MSQGGVWTTSRRAHQRLHNTIDRVVFNSTPYRGDVIGWTRAQLRSLDYIENQATPALEDLTEYALPGGEDEEAPLSDRRGKGGTVDSGVAPGVGSSPPSIDSGEVLEALRRLEEIIVGALPSTEHQAEALFQISKIKDIEKRNEATLRAVLETILRAVKQHQYLPPPPLRI